MKLLLILTILMGVSGVATACYSYEDCLKGEEYIGKSSGGRQIEIQTAIAIELHEIKEILKGRNDK